MKTLEWWQTAVFYQIYPRSFADQNGDGIGDIPGIIQRLDYLQDLGVDAIWLSPHYPSPLWDCGYDIADYTAVATEYGTLDDFKRMLDDIHSRDMHLILDLVLNHTSDQHPWFLESRSGRHSPKRDWYVWRDGKAGSPPNNWNSTFGGSAWEYDTASEQYYYHFFFKQQPDLNWRNPQVKEAVFEAVRFWLDMGVDGYRLDAIGTLFENPELTPHKATISQVELYRMFRLASSTAERLEVNRHYEAMFEHQHDLPETHDLLKDLRQVVNQYPGRVLVGETDDITYCGTGDDELHMVFNFPMMETERLTPAWVRANQEVRLAALPVGSWPANTLGNHDSPRVISHFGDGIHDKMIARTSLAVLLTLKGTPFLYNGEEIGMTDYRLEDIADFRDMLGIHSYEIEINQLDGRAETALAYASQVTRDKCRTPFQWRNAPNAGFSPEGVKTWLPVNPNYLEGINQEEQENDPESLLNFYRTILRVRRATPALMSGAYIPLHTQASGYLAFLRKLPEAQQICLVIINMSDQAYTLDFDLKDHQASLIYSSRVRPTERDNLAEVFIAPFEIYIAEVSE